MVTGGTGVNGLNDIQLATDHPSKLTSFRQIVHLKDPSQPRPFLMPSKLLILHGEAKSYCFTVSCVPVSVVGYLVVSFILWSSE